MAIGDDAAARGYPLVPESGDEGKVKQGAREINRTRDIIAGVDRRVTVAPSAPLSPRAGDLWFEPI